jgi:hypothetical protein
MTGSSRPRRSWRQWLRTSRRQPAPLLNLHDMLTALGTRAPCQPDTGRDASGQSIPVAAAAGTLARGDDFDVDLQPIHPHLRQRRDHIAALLDAGTPLLPVSLVRVGQLYFIADGHHRLSAAKARGQLAIDAQITTVCTVAYACHCLTREHLTLKAAERDFLTSVPLPDPATLDLWLDHPHDYQRLAAAARRWASHHTADRPLAPATARAWWHQDVLPLAHTHRHTDQASSAARYLLRTGEAS